MCGIAGLFSAKLDPSTMRSAADAMQQALVHRGPDDAGLWESSCGHAVLAHRRLSILDLSGAARQPMSTPGGRYTICFNGEIYNFRALREDLERGGIAFATTSDTEVILRLYERDGAACVKALRGMFAFAIWDAQEGAAFLARDPLGIKPLYVHSSEGTLAFASELRALVAGRVFEPTLCTSAVQRYFTLGSVPEPLTLLNEASMLEAGSTLTWKAGVTTTQRYWQIEFKDEPSSVDAVQRTREALIESVRHHFVSDVPVGVFLSGGIDSTAVLALANATGHEGIGAFCIAVDDEAADESDLAKRTAKRFRADYHEMRLDARLASTLFTEFLDAVDQPSIDGLNTFTVSALARREGMKVVLSGLGGDELFGGYASFQRIPKMMQLHRWMNRVPGAVRVAELALRKKPQGRRMIEYLRSTGGVEEAYTSLRGIFSQAEAELLTRWITKQSTSESNHARASHASVSDQISELEITRYMRNQLLRDSDVMSMSHGLELRVPFVDRTLLEAVAGIPAAVRLQAGKRLLTDAVPEVPEWVIQQRKRGFLFPYQKWLSTDWGQIMDAQTAGAPVPLTNWYQRWSVFVLRHAMKQLSITA